MQHKKKWSDLTTPQRAGVVVAAVAEIVLTSVALADLSRRPSAQVRGFKRIWALVCVVQPVGPLAYLLFGRRRFIS